MNVADAGAASADAGVPLATADAGVDPATLPQTRDKPTTYDDRGRALFEGVLSNEASMPAFFPVEAYKQVKAVGNPAGDFKARLVANYKRDVEALHKAIPSRAKYVRVDIPDGARWVEPNEEYNKIGYWRVFGAKVVYSVDDKEKSFPISSLISWRGEWFTVHLTGFK